MLMWLMLKLSPFLNNCIWMTSTRWKILFWTSNRLPNRAFTPTKLHYRQFLSAKLKRTSKNRLISITNRLFSSLPANSLNGSATIQTLLALFDNYEDNCLNSEVVTVQELAENDAFLNAILATTVMQQAHQFLSSKGRISNSFRFNS